MKLKNCPVCGRDNIAPVMMSNDVSLYWRVECVDCWCHTPGFTNQEEAVEAWQNGSVCEVP